MKTYVAIGHFKDSENITCVAMTQTSKKAFVVDCYGNAFVPYVVLTEKTLGKIQACADSMDIWEQVKKMTTNYRVWDTVADYLDECFDIIEEKVKAAQE